MKLKTGLLAGVAVLVAGGAGWRYYMVSAQSRALAKFYDLQKNSGTVQGTVTIEDFLGQEIRSAQFLAKSAKEYSVSMRSPSYSFEVYSDGKTQWIVNTNNARYFRSPAIPIRSTHDLPAFEPLRALSPMLFSVPWKQGFSWGSSPVLELAVSAKRANSADSDSAEGAFTLVAEISPDGTPRWVKQIAADKQVRRQATFEQIQFGVAAEVATFRYRPPKTAVAVADEGELIPFIPSKPIGRTGRQ